MPSPFPGMDPYLEDPGLWPDVHHRIIAIAGDLLGERLRPKYYVRIEERIYLADESDPVRSVRAPDLRIASFPGGQDQAFVPGGIGLDVAEPVVFDTMFEEDVHEARLEVIDREHHLTVAVIEVVSPANKVAGSHGRASFRQKRREVMGSPSHRVEIDLLRAGHRFTPSMGLPACEYLVHVSNAARRPRGLLWPIRLSQRLPVVSIPLLPEDPDVPLDLQAVLTTAYDRAAYDLQIDYRSDPVPPLSHEWADWSHNLLRDRGLR